MMTTSHEEKSVVKDIRLTMKQFMDALRHKKEQGIAPKLELALEKRGRKSVERARTVTETDDSVSSTTKSVHCPQSTPTSSPPLSPRLFLVSTPLHHTQVHQLTTSHLLQLNDDTTHSCHTDDWGQFTSIE